MALTIRRFDWEHDLETVCDFHKDHVRINFPDQKNTHLEFFKESLSESFKTEPEGMFILESDELPVGFLWLYTFYNKYRGLWMGQVNYIHVHKSYRGKGYGRKLLKKAHEYFSVKGIHSLRLSAMAQNSAALKLFESDGFKPKKIVMEWRK